VVPYAPFVLAFTAFKSLLFSLVLFFVPIIMLRRMLERMGWNASLQRRSLSNRLWRRLVVWKGRRRTGLFWNAVTSLVRFIVEPWMYGLFQTCSVAVSYHDTWLYILYI